MNTELSQPIQGSNSQGLTGQGFRGTSSSQGLTRQGFRGISNGQGSAQFAQSTRGSNSVQFFNGQRGIGNSNQFVQEGLGSGPNNNQQLSDAAQQSQGLISPVGRGSSLGGVQPGAQLFSQLINGQPVGRNRGSAQLGLPRPAQGFEAGSSLQSLNFNDPTVLGNFGQTFSGNNGQQVSGGSAQGIQTNNDFDQSSQKYTGQASQTYGSPSVQPISGLGSQQPSQGFIGQSQGVNRPTISQGSSIQSNGQQFSENGINQDFNGGVFVQGRQRYNSQVQQSPAQSYQGSNFGQTGQNRPSVEGASQFNQGISGQTTLGNSNTASGIIRNPSAGQQLFRPGSSQGFTGQRGQLSQGYTVSSAGQFSP